MGGIMTVRRFALLAVVVAVTAFGCSTAKNVIGVPTAGDPSVTIKSAETRWLLIKNPRFGDVPSEPEYVWVEEDKTPITFGTVVFGKGSIIAPPEIVPGTVHPRRREDQRASEHADPDADISSGTPAPARPASGPTARPGPAPAHTNGRRRKVRRGDSSSTWIRPGS
jgi:hypothetical protein